MSTKHQSPAYQRNARIIRDRVRSGWKAGIPATCWRGGGPIVKGQSFDVGHIDPNGGDGVWNLAPEHRTKTPGCCGGNRNIGGAVGAAIRNAKTAPTQVANVRTWNV